MDIRVARCATCIGRLFKGIGLGFLLLILVVSLAATAFIFCSGDPDYKTDYTNAEVNDVTQLNPIEVDRIIRPQNLAEIVAAVKDSTGSISIGGGRFSQGGQTAYANSLHLDMRGFNQIINLDEVQKLITIQAGSTWREIQEYIDPYNLSIKIMQTYANFTVGGSLSVNSHGRYIGQGPLVNSVRQIKLVLADGSLVRASPEENPEIFFGAIGGYGGLGVIVEATLELSDNVKVRREATPMAIEKYPEYFTTKIRGNKGVIFHNADVYPPNFDQVMDVSWYETDKALTHTERLTSKDSQYWLLPKVAKLVADFNVGKILRQVVIDPIVYRSEVVLWRNKEASYDVRELEPDSRREHSFVLREYFIPVENFNQFVPKMREIFQRHKVNVLNVSIRHALPDKGTLLAWAPREMFAFVVYYRQGTTRKDREEVKTWSLEMIEAAIVSGGSYYLPYQIFASSEQFKQAYPNADKYFRLKGKLDPDNRFINQLWAHHYPKNHRPIEARKFVLDQYQRAEEQTFLTVPEWYLVFNPEEYADYLEDGRNPSNFPFFESLNEYWALYDRVRAITDGVYPTNDEYLTVLQVIGVSTTVEYLMKGAYETSIGRFTRWLANDEDTEEDRIIAHAQRAYSQLIYDMAWYKFDFWSWVKKIWREPNFFGSHFIRKLERKLFFSLEFGFKALYARLVEFGAKSTYEQSDGLIYLAATGPIDPAQLSDAIQVLAQEESDYLLAVPRWGEFSKLVPLLAEKGFQFRDISGNNDIVTSWLLDTNRTFDSKYAQKLFESKLVSRPSMKRVVCVSRVSELSALLRQGEHIGLKFEHIYDY